MKARLLHFESALVLDDEVNAILSKRAAEKKLKQFLERMQEELKVEEQNLIDKIDEGADLRYCSYSLDIKETFRRYPAWKEHFVELAGKEAADRVTEETEPKRYRSIVIEAA